MKKTVLAIIIAMLTVSVLGFIGCTLHKHSFSNKVTTKAYLCSSATCTEKAKYYFSCKCGEKSSDTFEYGDPIGHSFTNYVSDNNGSLGKNGTKTAHCDHKGCTATDTILDDGSKSESKISFKTLSVGEKKDDGSILVYGKVSNDTKSFSFINEMETVGVIKYVVSLDIYGSQQVATKTIPLNSGDNVVYVIEMLDGEPQSVYEVTIRRRPIYTVSFDTRNGTKIPNQQIEEDSIITEPVTTRAGYTFVNWDYDFSQPITQDVTITASWTANTDTAYKVEYYFGSKDYNYTLCETVNLQGTSGSVVTA